MAKKSGAQVVLRGRFPAGARVELVQVKDETVLRSEGGKVVAEQTVGDDGEVRFSDGVKAGQRYLIRGIIRGVPRDVRVTGREDADDAAVLGQPPVQPDPVRLPGGQLVSELDNLERSDTPPVEVQPGVRQDQVPLDVAQRSDTPLGAGTPILDGEDEVLPYPKQEDVDDGTVQRSATDTGQATPLGAFEGLGQQDAPDGLLQRSDTPYGVLTPIPDGDGADATAAVQSPDAKAQGHEAAALEELGGEPPEAEGQSALNALRDPNNDEDGAPNATDDQAGRVPNTGLAPEDAPKDAPVADVDQAKPAPAGELTGAALKARAAELDIAGRGSMKADDLRKAIAKAEKR